jgi:hypothetical protein
MKRFRITLKSVGPMLQNRMGMDELLGLRDKTKKKSKTAAKLSLEEEAAKHVHYDADGRACIPKMMLLATLMNAGVFIRLDQKRQLSTKESSLLPGLLFLEDESYPLLLPGDGDEATWGYSPWRYEVRQGRNPNGGEAVCIVRPLFEVWAISFIATLDIDELPEDTFLRLFTLAGSRIGFGDFRPQRKGPFGMFAVTRWEKVGDGSVEHPKQIAA